MIVRGLREEKNNAWGMIRSKIWREYKKAWNEWGKEIAGQARKKKIKRGNREKKGENKTNWGLVNCNQDLSKWQERQVWIKKNSTWGEEKVAR